MFYGLLDLPWWGYIVATLVLTHITIASVTIFLHRAQAHRALELHAIPSHFFRLWLWLTTGMETKAWAAIHRKHHAKCETEEDPHSPQILGLKKVLTEGAELYRLESKNKETLERYGKGTPDDWIERHIYTPYSSKGIFITLAVDLLLFGVPGLTVWAVQMAWIPFFAAGVINGIGHFWGYRNYECPDASTNISPWGILIGGEELHNNHHTYPTSAKLSIKWWEFDIGWLYIKCLSILGLAKVKRLPPKAKVIPEKNVIDAETLKAMITNRFQIMAQYSKGVMMPILRQEREKGSDSEKSLIRRVKSLIGKEASLLDAQGKAYIERVLASNQSIEVVYQFRQQLQDIWDRTAASQKELLEALQEWCKQAEATGIQSLKDFSRYLKSYSLAVA